MNQEQLKRYRGLLDIMTVTTLGGEFQVLYRALDQIVHEKWGQSPFVVISRPRGERPKEKWRIHWNRDEGRIFLDSSAFQNVFENTSVTKDDEQTPRFHRKEGQDSTYLIAYIGIFNDQEYWGVFCEKSAIEDEFLGYLGSYLKRSFDTIARWKEMGEMSTLVYVDDVTGLYNQRKLMVDLDSCINKYEEFQESFSVLFLDIDYFKSVNDIHGHMVGTKVLRDLAALLNDVVRGSDMIYRYGGDEFVVILQNAAIDVGEVVGGRILEAVANQKFELTPENFQQLTVSIGIAAFPTHAAKKEDILSIADHMMYHAKKGGRGQVRLATELFSSLKKKEA